MVPRRSRKISTNGWSLTHHRSWLTSRHVWWECVCEIQLSRIYAKNSISSSYRCDFKGELDFVGFILWFGYHERIVDLLKTSLETVCESKYVWNSTNIALPILRRFFHPLNSPPLQKKRARFRSQGIDLLKRQPSLPPRIIPSFIIYTLVLRQGEYVKKVGACVTLNSPCLFNPFSTPNKWATRLLKILTRKREVAAFDEF